MRIEQRTYYVADDGVEFRDWGEAHTYEKLLLACNGLQNRIGPVVIDDHLKFANGAGYVQRNLSEVELVRDGLKLLANGQHPRAYYEDSGKWALRRLHYRLDCIDDHGREWGQPYYPNQNRYRLDCIEWIEPEVTTSADPTVSGEQVEGE